MTTRTHLTQWPVLLTIGSLAALGWTALSTSSLQVVYNASASVPPGWYRITPAGEPAVGDLVLVRLPANAAALAAQRGYLPTQVPLLKTVIAVAPQHVCVHGVQVLVDGKAVATRLRQDRLGRPLPTWQACRQLVGDELFLLSTAHPESFDSRYFGPVSADAVIGRAQPLWLESRR
jgi:conjugative transfer signal peptidase TraF